MSTTTTSILVALIGSALLGTLISNWQKTRQRRKEKIAGATESALKRVEMYYRILRRRKNKEDDSALRDLFHSIQESNDYYVSLLSIESPWLGYRYGCFIEALKRETEPLLQQAWASQPFEPSAQLKGQKHPDVKDLIAQFTKDSRRFFNPVMRLWMRIKFSSGKMAEGGEYGTSPVRR